MSFVGMLFHLFWISATNHIPCTLLPLHTRNDPNTKKMHEFCRNAFSSFWTSATNHIPCTLLPPHTLNDPSTQNNMYEFCWNAYSPFLGSQLQTTFLAHCSPFIHSAIQIHKITCMSFVGMLIHLFRISATNHIPCTLLPHSYTQRSKYTK